MEGLIEMNNKDKKQPVAWSKAYNKGRLNLIDVLPVDVPLCVCIEPTNVCNFKCLMCWQSAADYLQKGGPFEAMNEQIFKKIIDDLKDMVQKYNKRIKVIKLYSTGEPMIHPKIGKMVRSIKASGICDSLEITTNASMLTEELAKEFIEAGLDYLRVSIYSVRAERLSRITNQRKFTPDDIHDNIERLYNLRKAAGAKKPFICAKIMDTHDEENEEFKASYKSISDEQLIDIPWELPATGEGELEKLYGGEPEGAVAQQKYLDTSLYKRRKACRYPFTHITLRNNGDAVVCCLDWPRATKIGNIMEESIDDIWHGKQLYDFRIMQLKDHGKNHPLCATCELPLRDKPEDDIDALPIERLNWRDPYR